MGTLAPDNVLLTMIEAPAALCNATGVVTHQNTAFLEWSGDCVGARVEVHGGRGVLTAGDDSARALTMIPLHDGGWLAIGGRWDASGAVAAVTQALAYRLERIETSLEGNATLGLLEHPAPSVAASLREMLTAAQELKGLRQQVEALAGRPRERRAPVCLLGLVREAISVFPPKRVAVAADPEADYTVEVDRARLFTHVVGLIDAFSQQIGAESRTGNPSRRPLDASGAGHVPASVTGGQPAPSAGTHPASGSVSAGSVRDFRSGSERKVRVQLRGGDMVRLTLSVEGAAWPVACEPEVGDLRSFAAARGGRLLVEPEGAILVELPAYVRTSEVHPVTGAGTVLIVDDDESTLAMMSAVLRRAGFRVLSAENGVAASVLLRDHLPEIVAIVTDAVLPGRSGMELAEEARRYQPQVPVLLVSAHPTDLLGDADLVDVPLLSKPFGANALTDRVRRLVELAGEAD